MALFTNADTRPCPCPACQAYEELSGLLKEMTALNGISGLLGWDEMVSPLPHPSTQPHPFCLRNLPFTSSPTQRVPRGLWHYMQTHEMANTICIN